MKTLKEAMEYLKCSSNLIYRKLKRIKEYDKNDPENDNARYSTTRGKPKRLFTDLTIEKIKNLPHKAPGNPYKVRKINGKWIKSIEI